MHQQINLYQPVFRKRVNVFSATTRAQIAGAALDTEIEQLRTRINRRNYLLAHFGQRLVRHRSGFAGRFNVLAEQKKSGRKLGRVLLESGIV